MKDEQCPALGSRDGRKMKDEEIKNAKIGSVVKTINGNGVIDKLNGEVAYVKLDNGTIYRANLGQIILIK